MVRSPMAKKDNMPFLLRPSRRIVNRLTELSARFNRDSANQVAVEILRDYADLWAEAEQSKYDAIVRQQEAVSRAIKAETLRRPMHKAETEPVKPQAHRRKK